eukprot:TRINITY_DN17669_c0_g1_i2.p1 TRINITY_DN17669_c0_g1~~TRINITY_DN17669_c0_g1_i2.p1  ORF type:complete len:218 (-),score=18.75 TRINITY_DN17669_c0_g1_i2:31-684(-)
MFVGGYDPALLQDGTKVTFYRTADDNSWSLSTKGIVINDENRGVHIDKVYFSMNSESILIPPHTLAQFLLAVHNSTGHMCSPVQDKMHVCACSEDQIAKFPSFDIYLQNNEKLRITPDQYIVKRWSGCLVYLWVSPNNHTAHLGLPFLRKYLSVFDVDQRAIGLGPMKSRKYQDDATALLIFPITFVLFLVGLGITQVFKSNAAKEVQMEQSRFLTR